MNPDGNYDFRTYVISGMVAGAMAGAVTNPLDVIKTRLQTQSIGCNVEGCDVVLEPGSRSLGLTGRTGIQPGTRMARQRKNDSRQIMTSAETDVCVRRTVA